MSKTVNFETAKGLKAIGYDIPSLHYYNKFSREFPSSTSEPDNYNSNLWAKGYYSAPFLNAVCDWLRDALGLHVAIDVITKDEWYYEIQNIGDGNVIVFKSLKCDHDTALSAAILHAITIIKSRGLIPDKTEENAKDSN